MTNNVEVLQKELNQLEKQEADLQLSLADKPEYGLGKGDPAITRWELDYALLEQTQTRIAELQQALGRVQKGTYGLCERCGQPIHPDRLAVLPDTKLCIQCARHD